MKFLPVSMALCWSAVLPMSAQDVETAEANATRGETGITGPISDGTPGLPPPKPEPIPFMLKSAITRRVLVEEAPEMPGLPAAKGMINVTVELVKDPVLPDPSPPLPALPPSDPAVLARLAEMRKTYRETELVFVSATVFDHSRTFLRCYPSGDAKNEICGWSNLDFNHFSGFGAYQVKGADGQLRQYGLMMGIGNENTQRRAEWLAMHNKTYEFPRIPLLPDLRAGGPQFVVTSGDTNNHDAMELIEGMHRLYEVEGQRMADAYNARIEAYDERKAYLLANPPVPKDVVIQVWKRDGAALNDNGRTGGPP